LRKGSVTHDAQLLFPDGGQVKQKSLRERIEAAILLMDDEINWPYQELRIEKAVDRILRLFRDEQKRKCAECLRVKLEIEKQIEANNHAPDDGMFRSVRVIYK
jgi:hypothetical protein